MIDWLNLLYHLFWLSGVALIIIAFSYHDWLAQQQQIKTSQILGEFSFQLSLTLGMILISIGLICLAQRRWEQLVWGCFILFFGQQLWQLWRTETR